MRLRLTLLSTIQTGLLHLLSGYHPFDDPSSERMSEVLEVHAFDEYAAEDEVEGDWDLLVLTGGQICVIVPLYELITIIFEQHSRLLISLFPSLLLIFPLAVYIVPALSYLPVVDTPFVDLKITLETNIERINAL